MGAGCPHDIPVREVARRARRTPVRRSYSIVASDVATEKEKRAGRHLPLNRIKVSVPADLAFLTVHVKGLGREKRKRDAAFLCAVTSTCGCCCIRSCSASSTGARACDRQSRCCSGQTKQLPIVAARSAAADYRIHLHHPRPQPVCNGPGREGRRTRGGRWFCSRPLASGAAMTRAVIRRQSYRRSFPRSARRHPVARRSNGTVSDLTQKADRTAMCRDRLPRERIDGAYRD